MKYKRFPKALKLTIRITQSDMDDLLKVIDILQMDLPDLVRMYVRKNNYYYLNTLKNKAETIEKIEKQMRDYGYENQDTEK